MKNTSKKNMESNKENLESEGVIKVKIYNNNDNRIYVRCIRHNVLLLSAESKRKHRHCSSEVFR